MNASSASGLCARRMVRLAGTRASGGDLGRLGVEGVEVVRMLGVLGPPAGALGGLVPRGTFAKCREQGPGSWERYLLVHRRKLLPAPCSRRGGAPARQRAPPAPRPPRPTAAPPATPPPGCRPPERRTCDKTSPWPR